MTYKISILCLFFSCLAGCKENKNKPSLNSFSDSAKGDAKNASPAPVPDYLPGSVGNRSYEVVHVFVVLCDNKHQGIVPVPAVLGNGQDPKNNLYWGAMYGVKTFFSKQAEWEKIACSSVQSQKEVLDFAAYKKENVYVFAQAYDGACMKSALRDFFLAAAGRYSCNFQLSETNESEIIQAGCLADMICFIGHNGLMDVNLTCPTPAQGSHRPEWAVVLACKSDPYFSPLLINLHCRPLVTTSGFMAPEAYTLEAILQSWSRDGDITSIQNAAAAAYSRYQKCSLNAARKLFVSYQDGE